jgi:hypothetical protein
VMSTDIKEQADSYTSYGVSKFSIETPNGCIMISLVTLATA